MSTPRGEFNRRLCFEREVPTTSGFGTEPSSTWDDLGGAWVKVLYGRGQERRNAAAEGATMSITFRVLSSPRTRDITERDRIRFDGLAWDIASIAPIGIRDEIEFTATASKG